MKTTYKDSGDKAGTQQGCVLTVTCLFSTAIEARGPPRPVKVGQGPNLKGPLPERPPAIEKAPK
jgi:hypothetical protein